MPRQEEWHEMVMVVARIWEVGAWQHGGRKRISTAARQLMSLAVTGGYSAVDLHFAAAGDAKCTSD